MARDVRELGGAWTRSQQHAFTPPDPDLAPFVARLWHVSWDYPEPYRQKIVPYPQVHLTVRPGVAPPEVHGAASRHVVKELAGHGSVVGAALTSSRRWRAPASGACSGCSASTSASVRNG